MQVTFWGVRGSIPAPGPDFNRYGGNTPCVSVRTREGALLILDAGTGLNVLGRVLMRGEFGRGAGRATLLLTHAHWDHIQGFPFFAPFFVRGNRFSIFGPSESPAMVEGILEGQMNPAFSPIHSLRNMGAEIQFFSIGEGSAVESEGARIEARFNAHGRYTALAYRIEEGPSVLVYAPDAGYLDGRPPEKMLALYRGASCLIHDCTYTPEDQGSRRSRGSSSIAEAARAAAAAGARTLAMFHYDQDYTDDHVDELARRCRELLDREEGGEGVELVAAREGLTLEI
jgi:phosphoribosyl 1,2-cyclic phosphodiesterase